MITVQNLSKRYGGQIIFEEASFSLDKGERAGLTGRNGHGKSTLFRILAGHESPDEGEITIPRGYRPAFLTQEVHFTRPTVIEESLSDLPPERKNEEWKARKILSGLGFTEIDFSRSPVEFSGGYQMRISLSKILLAEPDLLLLDEPTNFLDILSIRFLEGFLKAWKGELMVISHDRGFMDSVTESILGIHRRRIRKIHGKTEDYYASIAKQEEIHEKNRLNAEKRRRQMEEFVTRFRAKARQANLAQSRIKTLEKMEMPEKLASIETLSFSFNYSSFPAKTILESRNLSFSYSRDTPALIRDFHFNLGRSERVCIVGKNGKGKTTLLKLLSGVLIPVSGEVKKHPLAREAYFEQAHTASLSPELTVEEEILRSQGAPDTRRARDICGAMMFSGDNALKKISVISGGEKCRVLLGKLLAAPANLLLLDEPTHHLDMESSDALIRAVERFEGASVIVTHNEHLLRRLAERLIVFHRDRLFVFEGGYDDFLDRVGWDDGKVPETALDRAPEEVRGSTRRDLRRVRAEFFTRRSRTLQPLADRMNSLERRIHDLEKQARDETDAMLQASAVADIDKIRRLTLSIGSIRAHIDSMYPELFQITEQYEAAGLTFETEERALP